jgi:hypothetical protein
MDWTSFPFKEDKSRGILVLCFIFVLSAGVFFLLSRFFSFLTFIVLFLSVIPYYSPTHYKIDKDGIVITHLGIKREKKWNELKRCYIEKNGIFLSPFDINTRLENYRGIFVRVKGETKNNVIEFIKKNTNLKIIGG